jgi:hypothetical protein
VVRFRVDPYELRDDLLEHFRESGCLAVKEGRGIIDAQLLNSVSNRHDRGVIEAYVLAWREAHPQAQIEISSR